MTTDGALFLRGAARMLHNMTAEQEQELESHTHAPSSSSSRTSEDSFLMFASVIVGLIGLAYCFCMYQMFRMWFLRFCCGQETSGRINVVHEGRSIDLNSNQRRAVLEAIFSETSKAVTEKDMMKPKRKRKIGGNAVVDYSSEDDDQVPYDVEIPTISTAGSEGTQDSSYSMEVQAEENHNNEGQNPNSKNENYPPQPIVRALSWDPPDTLMSPSRAVSPGPIALALTRSSSWVGDGTTNEKMDSTTPPSPKSSSPLTTLPPQQDAAVQVFRTPTASRDDYSDGGGAISPASSNGDNFNSESGFLLRSASSLEEDACGESAPLYAVSLIGATRGKDTANKRSLALPSSMNLKPRTTTVAVFPESGESAAADADADAEESKREEETASSSTRSETRALSAPFTLLRVDSLSHYSVTSNSEYTNDDETEGNVCAICLSGYKEGDVLIASKYCTHIFHKDCILEWLDKHDECPVCRVDMVTEGEINKAATSLVGKTRMCKAVASLSSAPLLRTSPPHRTPPTSPGPRGPHTPTNTVRRMGNSQR